MADVFGLAASAAGIVSLGLQVYAGVSSYVEGIKDRKTELSAVIRQANTLQTAVSTLQDAVPRINAVSSNNGSPIVPALKTAEEELWAIRLFLGALQEQHVANQDSDFAMILKQQKKKFTFPFHRPTLEKLQKKLESANNALQTSLQVADLSNCLCGYSVWRPISGKFNVVHGTLSLAPTQASIDSIEGKLDSLMMDKSLERNLQFLNANVGHVSEEMHKALSTVATSTAAILTEVMDRKLAEMMSRLSTKANTPTNITQGQLVMGRLLSKPSDLKDACDLNSARAVSTRRAGLSSHRTHRTCDCHTRPVKYHEDKKFGDFFSFKRGAIQRQHLPDCEFEAYNHESTSHVRGIAYTGLRWILSRSVELSMSWTSGAGGSSIGPSITLRPMVDETRSPVFRIINLVSNKIECSLGTYVSMYNRHSFIKQILDHSVNAILRSYRGRRCSIYDVNGHGESVLYKWMTLLSGVYRLMWKSDGFFGTSHWFQITAGPSVRRLIPEQLTGSLSNYNGVSPLVNLFNGHLGVHYLADFSKTLEVLYSYDNELFEQTRDDIQRYSSCFKTLPLDLQTISKKPQNMIDILDIGPLSRSILNENTEMMRSLLKRDLNLLAEMNCVLQTPFHLAADMGNTKALAVLIEATRGSSTQFDTPDTLGQYALDCLMTASGLSCRDNLSTHCRYRISFDILQSVGWRLSPRVTFLPGYYLWRICDSMRVRLISTMKQARKELRATARRHLSVYDRQRFQLDSPQILDAHAYDVMKRMIDSGINLPQGYKDLYQSGRIVSGDTVYHSLCEQSVLGDRGIDSAKLLHRRGFTDFDHENADGETPLERLLEIHDIAESPALFVWFVQHGADLSRALHGKSRHALPVRGLKLAHRILGFDSRVRIHEVDSPTVARIIRMISPSKIHDECCCGCVETGCTTTTILFRSLWKAFFVEKRLSLFDRYSENQAIDVSFLELASISGDDEVPTTAGLLDLHDKEDIDMENVFPAKGMTDEESSQMSSDDERYQTVLQKCARSLAKFLQALQIDFAQWSHVCFGALRLFTFEALKLRHTCHCGTWEARGHPCRNYSEEVIREMQEEDRDLLHLLDGLVEEFVDELESSGDTFESFLIRYWVGRVEVVLKVLEATRMSPEQVRAAEKVGVIWEYKPVGQSKDQRSSLPEPTPSELLETLISEIDKIVEESI